MRVIAHSPSNNTSYVIDPKTCHIEWAGSHEACEAHLRYMAFYDFYYSAIDIHGRHQTPAVTINYWDVFRPDYIDPTPYDGIASGWWDREIFHNANGTLDGKPRARFWACYLN